MPLQQGSSKKIISHNIAELVNASHPQKQAAAIAYKEAGEAQQTRRIPDVNGWVEIKANPLTKTGVFPYSGAQVDPAFDPNEIIMVYRPEEELTDPECIESFKLIPWIDEHEMLGSEAEGMTPAEEKVPQGVIGQEVFYEAPYLKGNIKVFSEKLADEIQNNGKKELSIGYRCLYEIKKGVYNGQKYDAIQRKIRGNHLALVDEGRAGPDVAVLDQYKFAFDSLELNMMQPEIKKDEAASAPTLTLESLDAEIKGISGNVAKLMDAFAKMGEAPKEQEPILDADPMGNKPCDEKENEDSDEEENKEAKAKDEEQVVAKPKDEMKTPMDAALMRKSIFKEMSQRNKLYEKLSPVIGVFDHEEMPLLEVARYGIRKLGLDAAKGQEVAVLTGYLAGLEANSGISNQANKAMDTSEFKNANDYFDKFYKGSAN